MVKAYKTGMGVLRLLALGAVLAACQEVVYPVPSAEQVSDYYAATSGVSVSMEGSVAEVTVTQPSGQLRRGGSLWAKVGPYVFLFSDETRLLMEDHPGLSGVRVVTRSSRGDLVGSALLRNGSLSETQWRRALSIAGKARLEGTQRPSLLEDLVRWGEDRSEFEYNPRYTRP